MEHGQGVTAPNPHAPRATAGRPTPLQAGAWSTRRGLRVEVIDSFESSFVEGACIYLVVIFGCRSD